MIPGLCEVTEPPLAEVEPGHLMSCHIPLEELRRLQEPRRASSSSPPEETALRAGRGSSSSSVDEPRRVRVERDERVRRRTEASVRVHDGPPERQLAARLDVDVDAPAR